MNLASFSYLFMLGFMMSSQKKVLTSMSAVVRSGHLEMPASTRFSLVAITKTGMKNPSNTRTYDTVSSRDVSQQLMRLTHHSYKVDVRSVRD